MRNLKEKLAILGGGLVLATAINIGNTNLTLEDLGIELPLEMRETQDTKQFTTRFLVDGKIYGYDAKSNTVYRPGNGETLYEGNLDQFKADYKIE